MAKSDYLLPKFARLQAYLVPKNGPPVTFRAYWLAGVLFHCPLV